MQEFVHLNTRSHYSILEAIGSIGDIINKAQEFGFKEIALTDVNNMFGAIEFYEKATKANLKPILGVNLSVTSLDGDISKPYSLTLLAKSYQGYTNLIELVSLVRINSNQPVSIENLTKYSQDLICLSGNYQSEISDYLLHNPNLVQNWLDIYSKIFQNNLYLELLPLVNTPDQVKVNSLIIDLGKKHSIPIVLTAQSMYLEPNQRTAHDIMLAIKNKTNIQNLDRVTFVGEDYSLKSVDEMQRLAKELKIPEEALTNTSLIADKCNVEIPLYQIQLPKFDVPPLENGEILDNEKYLKFLCEKGIQKRYVSQDKKEILERLDYEFGVIKNAGYIDYFLIVSDFITWAKNNNILVGPGRGSAAGSLVAYLLEITDIDPLAYQLLFERFLNPARVSMPDIDIDFQDNKRELVLNYVAQKYGQDHVAQICTFGTMAAKAAIRDTGRALGYSYGLCDSIAKLIEQKTIAKSLANSRELRGRYEQEEKVTTLINTAQQLEGSIRHTSTHACAVVISPKKLTHYTPLQTSESGGKTSITTQYEMHAIEDLGLLKMDFLGLSNLSTIETTLNLIQSQTGTNIDINNLDTTDKLTYKLFQKGQTTGVFQFESQGMKKALIGLKPSEFNDLIAMVSLYRPGPMELIPTYIARKHKKEEVTYLHPNLESILKPTYGIMIYQEQLMQASQAVAGFSLPEADTLRKAVGKKIKELMEEQKINIIEGAVKQGISREIGEKLWELIEPFGDYGFNKSHAACYAMIAYQTAYLKAHYPLQFMVALLNSDAKDMTRIAIDITEARQLGLIIKPPSVNVSQANFTGSDNTIFYGLGSIKNMSSNLAEYIEQERNKNGQFQSLEDFINRIPAKELNKKNLEALVKAGALDEFEPRHILIHNLDNILSFIKTLANQNTDNIPQNSLFGSTVITTPKLELENIKTNQTENLNQILELENIYLGLWISTHPINEYKNILEELKLLNIKEIKEAKRKSNLILTGVIKDIKIINTKSGAKMAFLNLEDISDNIEVIIFPSIYRTLGEELNTGAGFAIKGKRQDKDGVSQFIASEAKVLKAEDIQKWTTSKSSTSLSNSVEEIGFDTPEYTEQDSQDNIPTTQDGAEIVGINIIIPPYATPEALQKVKDILTREARGKCPVYLIANYNTPKMQVKATNFSVHYSDELVARIRYILNNPE
jgi:DNA polymerase-3 subunit alpha